MAAFKNIIFDLGGVLLDIDPALTARSFEDLGVKDFETHYSLKDANELFKDLECGRISETEFYKAFNQHTGLYLPDEVIRRAWCALLLQFRESSLKYLDELAPHASLYLLSNTNIIHQVLFEKIYDNGNRKKTFEQHFKHCYYSFAVGRRKPDRDCYEWVLNDASLRAEETIFIDDNRENIEAASAIGIKAIQLKTGVRIEDLNLLQLIS